ncbi:MAG TPA: cobalamin biosynthesis protein [Nocardioides sp.]|uniref:cobalamin biosynthesis protein n=1 Tax=Nocardioides sp. TaxID=35761 RepID=UPI002E3712A5|nr:cobalamin biosynthesis protein [Nocardioides sp.]HEX3931100.1 cobalamin biosynthesis protein [Nocardioides sp.]
MRARALGLLVGYVADLLLGDPARFHPVAGFGRVAARAETASYADSRLRGVAHTTALVGLGLAVGAGAQRTARHRPLLEATLVAATTWTVLGGRSLAREAAAVHELLGADDLPGARSRLTHLVGRDTSGLDESEVSRAVVESVAENTADAVVAPLIWGATAGIPGLLAYRAANTLDAMVGHHSARYERFGWASARLDDLLNLPAARLTGLLGVVASPGRRAEARQVWRRDAAGHPSPNAGIPEAVFAGSLGIRLGGRNRYADRPEERARLGDGRAPGSGDIARAAALARRVGHEAAVVCCVAALVRRGARGG